MYAPLLHDAENDATYNMGRLPSHEIQVQPLLSKLTDRQTGRQSRG